MPKRSRIQVFGPAYLDRILVVDRPLTSPGKPPIDLSVDGSLEFGPGLEFVDPTGVQLTVELPPGWPGPTGMIRLSRRLDEAVGAWPMTVKALSWRDDLGGMGAGFAAALHGQLYSALGAPDDPFSGAVSARLASARIRHHPIRVSDRPADWTLLLTSGPHGDKLPVGFRGCHLAVESIAFKPGPCDLRIVASLPNRLSAQVLALPGAGIRLFAPSHRNMTDTVLPVSAFARHIDVLCCNLREWGCLADREEVAWQVSLLAITDGPAGASVRFTRPDGDPGHVTMPAFPRDDLPRDTNRAGEAFASTLIATLVAAGWSPGVTAPELAALAATRAAAAAALVLDRERFGFPDDHEIEMAVRAGRVDRSMGADRGQGR